MFSFFCFFAEEEREREREREREYGGVAELVVSEGQEGGRARGGMR